MRTTKDIKPFSFFNNIVYNPKKHQQKDLKLILKHEQIHARQWHSLDVIFISILCVVFWFNPFIWLYKKVIVQNLEFLADQDAVATIASKKEYQKALVMASVGMQPAMTNQFYQSFIKKRIIMLNKSKKKNTSWKTILVIPFLCLFLYSFNLKKESVVLNSSKGNRSQYTDTVDNPEITGIGSYTETEKNNTYKSPKRSISLEDLGENALYILDNQNYKRDELEGKTIVYKSIQVIAPETAVKQFGEKGKDGVVKLSKTEFIEDFQTYLKDIDKKQEAIQLKFLKFLDKKTPSIITLNKEKSTEKTVEESSKDKERSTINGKGKVATTSSNILNDTLYILNGVPQKSNAFLNDIEKNDIENITYLEGKKARALYGSRVSKYGVKLYTTKVQDNSLIIKNQKQADSSHIIILRNNHLIDGKPLLVINGKVEEQKTLENIKPNDIIFINVLKDKKASEKYKNDRAVNGVIEVYTKTFKGKLPQKSTTFVYTIHPNETDAAIQNIIKAIQETYDIEINIKKLKRDDSGILTNVKIKARHKGASFWNVTYSASSSDSIDEFYMIMDTEKDDFKITSEKPKKK
ncbi:M56 family metallopeptidase [Zunongwangia endophytica]|uniref:M56 family metallopeptidase n=1 Tax=Zunongwangia endophytica TaxID=1808945 RepID=UPI0025B29360|nr:M56 family metallopeptidase [Zunongwangia endophytica]MDN3596996.1 M56 family metallopeptidase [Zunongwangia endophytica]